MRRSRISAIFYSGGIFCLGTNIFLAPDLEWEYNLFVFPSAILITLLILSLIMALKETEDHGGIGTLGNARYSGFAFFFLSIFFLFIILFSVILENKIEDIYISQTAGVYILLWILSDILSLIGAIVYKKV